jgi:predicted double-glycine peptidase
LIFAILWLFLEMVVGLGVSGTFVIFGAWNGRRLRKMGLTSAKMQEKMTASPGKMLLWLVAGAGIVGALVWLDQEMFFFARVAGYASQALLVLTRSLIGMILGYQSRLDNTGFFDTRSAKMLGLTALLLTVLEAALLVPVAVTLGPGTIDEHGVVRQTTGTTCGPCALAIIARCYGSALSEKEAAVLMRTNLFGARFDQTVRGAKAAGFPEASFWKTSLAEIAREDRPVVLCVKLFGEWDRHAVALVGITSGTLHIADPLKGLITHPMATFAQEWRGTAIRVGAPAFAPESAWRLSEFSVARFREKMDQCRQNPP